jgi:hypothetical protein
MANPDFTAQSLLTGTLCAVLRYDARETVEIDDRPLPYSKPNDQARA